MPTNLGPAASITVNTQTPTAISQSSSTVIATPPTVTLSGATAGAGLLPVLVAQTAIPVGIANTGTMGANGALTLGTALVAGASLLYANCYMYFPAGAVYSGSVAGFYFTKMASTTTGTVYNNIYTASGTVPTVPSPLVSVVDAGPGAYTGVTSIQTALSISVPGNIMGPNGSLELNAVFSWNNSAGTKTPGLTFGGAALLTGTATTTAETIFLRTISNRGVTNAQLIPGVSIGSTVGNAIAAVVTLGQVDTTQAQSVVANLTIATATDYVFIEYLRVSAIYGA